MAPAPIAIPFKNPDKKFMLSHTLISSYALII